MPSFRRQREKERRLRFRFERSDACVFGLIDKGEGKRYNEGNAAQDSCKNIIWRVEL